MAITVHLHIIPPPLHIQLYKASLDPPRLSQTNSLDLLPCLSHYQTIIQSEASDSATFLSSWLFDVAKPPSFTWRVTGLKGSGVEFTAIVISAFPTFFGMREIMKIPSPLESEWDQRGEGDEYADNTESISPIDSSTNKTFTFSAATGQGNEILSRMKRVKSVRTPTVAELRAGPEIDALDGSRGAAVRGEWEGGKVRRIPGLTLIG